MSEQTDQKLEQWQREFEQEQAARKRKLPPWNPDQPMRSLEDGWAAALQGNISTINFEKILRRGRSGICASRDDRPGALPDQVDELIEQADEVEFYFWINSAAVMVRDKNAGQYAGIPFHLKRIYLTNIRFDWSRFVVDARRAGFDMPLNKDDRTTARNVTLRLAPGPKGGEQSVDERAWKIAVNILRKRDRPARGRGRLTELAQLVNAELENQGIQRQDDSIRKSIGRSLREWERKNPNK